MDDFPSQSIVHLFASRSMFIKRYSCHQVRARNVQQRNAVHKIRTVLDSVEMLFSIMMIIALSLGRSIPGSRRLQKLDDII